MDTTFARFPPRLQEAIVARVGWTQLRPVQDEAGAALLDGKNAVVLAPTAGGKTEASLFPSIANIMEKEPEGVGIIYISPIKALLNNQADRFEKYTSMVGLSHFVWHGDVKQSAKKSFIKEPATVLMTTPESLEVMLVSSRVPHQSIFADLRVLIIDEVHALAGTDRGAHLMSVFERVVRVSENDVQRVGLSATVGNPNDILRWLQGTSKRDACVVDPPKPPSTKDIQVRLKGSIFDIADDAAALAKGKKSLFFCQSRALTETVADRMAGRGVDVFVHHGSVSAEERGVAEERFERGGDACIVCTSTLELGIDVGDLDSVMQANAPNTVSSFLQRLGRTGRREDKPVANTTFLCEDPEIVLQAVGIVELAKKNWVESVPRQTRCWPTLVHQILVLCLQFGGVSRERCWDWLSVVPDFAGISQPEFDGLIEHMLHEGFLFDSGGLLSLGDMTERVFGKKNFMELYAVFSTPQLYAVKTEAGHPLGSLEQTFVDKLVEEMSSFLLAGKAWTVAHVNHDDRTVRVQSAPRGKKPSWGGFAPQLLGYEVCQEIADVIRGEGRLGYIDTAAQTAVDALREDLGPLLREKRRAVEVDPDRGLWWTFAGGQINHTLRYGFEILEGWTVIPDNFRIRIEGDGVGPKAINDAIEQMSARDFWAAPDTQRQLLARLPEYRLSKFQRAMPESACLEMISSYMLDTKGAARFLESCKPS